MLEQRTLTEIMNSHGSDKGTAHWPRHNYAWLYDEWLANKRHQQIRMLEIGVSFKIPCASLLAWAEYFPHGEVVGYDLDQWDAWTTHPRISTFVGDQSSVADLSRFKSEVGGSFDLIIDDGSHQTAHQCLSFAHLFPLVRSGGLYIVEDCRAETLAAFDPLHYHGVMLPPPESNLSDETCLSLCDLVSGCVVARVNGGARRKLNNVVVIYRQ